MDAIFTYNEDSFLSKEVRHVQSETDHDHVERPSKRPRTEAQQGKFKRPAQIRDPEKDDMPRKKFRADDPSQTAGIPINPRPAIPDYALKYIVVINLPQRLRYQKSYDAYYEEYCALRAQVESGAEVLMLQAAQRRSLPPGNKISEKERHEALQRCERLQADWQKLVYLHDRLLHIKKLCDDFDIWWKESGVWFQSFT